MQSNRQKRIVLSNSYGTDNVGDQAILISMIETLKKQLPDVQIDVLSRWPEKTRKRHPGIKAVRSGILRGFFDTCKSIRQADLLVIGGGGLIQDASSFGNLIFCLSRAVLARLFGTPFVGIGLGVGPISAKVGQLLTRIVLNEAKSLYVRDEKSAGLLRDIGVNRPEVVVTADIVFGLDYGEHTENQEAYQSVLNLKKEGKHLIGLSLRPEVGKHRRHSHRSIFFEEFLREMAAACDQLVEKTDAQIVFVSMHPEQDDSIGSYIQQLMKSGERMVLLSGGLDPRVTAATVGLLDLLIGMRLHAVIFAVVAGIPFIAFEYDPKVSALCKSLEQEQQMIPLREFEAGKLVKQAERILGRLKEISGDIRKYLPELKSRAKRNMEVVFELLEK